MIIRSDGAMIQLFSYLQTYRNRFVVACSSSVVNKVLDLMPPLLVAWVIDTVSGAPPKWIISVTGTTAPLALAITLSAIAVLIFAFESVFQWMYQFSFQTLAQYVQHDLRVDTYSHLQTREMAFFENHRLGETLSIINDDVNQLERFLNNGFNELLQLAVVILFCVVVMYSTSWQLASITLFTVPLVIFGSLYYQKKIAPHYSKIRQEVGQLNARLENNISGITVIKSFTAESFETDRVKDSSMGYVKANVAAVKLNTLYVPLIRMVVATGFAGILVLGSYWILSGSNLITVGQLVLFSMLIQRLLWPLTTLGNTIDTFERSAASAKRVFDFLNQKTTVKEPKNPVKPDPFKADISFKKVNFSYYSGQPILNSFCLDVKEGESIGIAGTTGAGKSTFIKLLLRLYDVNEGSLTIGGEPIQNYSLHDLRRKVALVSQDIYLFHGTIFENIAYGMPDCSNEAVVKAAKLSELDSFVQTLPDKYNTLVGERGIKLSGGQKQRLSIARAILKDAPIMVFDEATSSVDTETERSIQRHLAEFTQGKTALIIAHRLSTIRHADRIIVLDEGRIVEEGHHDELLAKKGVYSDLWSVQIGESNLT